MSAGIVLAARAHGDVVQIAGVLAGLGAVLAITLALLLAAPELARFLGITAQRVMMRVFGILLAAIAVQALFDQVWPRALQAFDGAALCPHVTLPTLCLAGAEDVLTLPREVEATAALLPNAQHEVFAQAGHSLLLESKHAYDRVVAFAQA